jgi:endo-alpha-1,4-polygalactosaminidase (GH114 family)
MNAPPRSHRRSVVRRALVGIVLIGVMAMGGAWLLHASIDPAESVNVSGNGRERLAAVTSWALQLGSSSTERLAEAPHDLLVIDPWADASGAGNPASAAALKVKPDGTRRVVMAQLTLSSIDDSRPDWSSAWAVPAAAPMATAAVPGQAAHAARQPITSDRPLLGPSAGAPTWLGGERADHRGTFEVRYWQSAWRHRLFGSVVAEVDRVIAAGYDGMYLTGVATSASWRHERPTADTDMTALVGDIAGYARRLKPDFIVVVEDGERVLDGGPVTQAIDGIAKHSVFFTADGSPHQKSVVDGSVAALRKAAEAGLTVLTIEHLSSGAAIDRARELNRVENFIPFVQARQIASIGRRG